MGLLLALVPCFNYIVNLLQSMMRAQLMNKAYAWIGLIQAALLMLTSIFFVVIVGAYGVVPARYLSAALVLVLSVVVLRRYIFGFAKALQPHEKRSFLLFSLSLLAANMFSMIIPLNESLLVNNIVCDAVVIANFKIAVLIPQQITFFTSAIMMYFTPYLARMKPDVAAWRYSVKIELLNLVIVAFVILLGVVLTPQIIVLAYGEQYLDTVAISALMWLTYGLNAALRVVPLNILPMLGFAKFNLVCAIVTSGIHLALDIILIHAFGVYGAAYAGMFVYLLSGLAYWAYLKKKTYGGLRN